MKFLLLLTLIFSTTIFAYSNTNKVMDFYQGNFELVSVEPMCPPSVPGGVSCMAIGSTVNVKSYAGCLGEEAFFDAKVVYERGITKFYITSLIKTDLDMEMRVRCAKLNEVKKSVLAPAHTYGKVEIINKEIVIR